MDRCLRVDVVEGGAGVVFVEDLRRDFTGDDFFEEGHDGRLKG